MATSPWFQERVCKVPYPMWSVGLKAELGWLSPGSESAPASYSAETWVWTLELQVEDGLNHPRAVGWDLSCPGGKKKCDCCLYSLWSLQLSSLGLSSMVWELLECGL